MKKYVIYMEYNIVGLNPPRFGWCADYAPPSSDIWEGVILDSYDDHISCSEAFHGYFRIRKAMDVHVNNASMMGATSDVVDALRSLIPPKNQRPETPLYEKIKARKDAMDLIFPVPDKVIRRPVKAIQCVESGAIFRSQYEAAQATGVASSSINAHIRGRAGHGKVRGFTFIELWHYRGEYTLGRHPEMVAEWERQRDDPYFGKRIVTAWEALEYRRKREAELPPRPVKTDGEWTPPEDGKE